MEEAFGLGPTVNMILTLQFLSVQFYQGSPPKVLLTSSKFNLICPSHDSCQFTNLV